jgi:hypothetical protein
MHCHYICIQLERIREAGVSAAQFNGGSTGLEEELQIMELAISNIRDEMGRRSVLARATDASSYMRAFLTV